jgi:hypothetical protein
MACGQQEPLSCKGHKNTSHLSCPILPSFLTHSNVTLHAYKMKQPLSMHKLYIAETIKGNKHQKDGTFWMHHPTSSIQVNSSHCKLCSITTQCIKQKKNQAKVNSNLHYDTISRQQRFGCREKNNDQCETISLQSWVLLYDSKSVLCRLWMI